MGCLDNLPTSFEPTYGCASELVATGPVSALLVLVIGIPLIGIAKRYLRKLFDRTEFDEALENFIYRIAGVAMWALVILTAASELGINVTGIVAAFGILGLAVAFAAQDTMENVIAGVFIIVDRPFREGERILLPKSLGGTYSSWGDVKEVGLRTTRVRSTDGVMLTIPNKLLTKDAVANFSHRSDMELRVRIRLGVTPTWANVSKAEEIAKDIAANHPDICNDPKPPEVVLRDFGDQDVIMEIRYYVDNAKKMRPSKSFFVTEILRRFEESKVSLAFPVMVNMNSDVSLEDLGF
ncbi:MAG: mechanosensitive ion channel family protein [Candidatus Thermoplasmatota archaeon]|jgi:small-conductance mechanosensitive channel|uniref:Mechanosensitive ion channel (MscS) (YnaI, mscMJ, MSL) n=1 Tax=uncultured marine group II/III euryarchaeote AD1000_09_E08 TaxID=1457711 RepID=A0A075FML5_9EURY|nr:mechanosensitive ion channel (MscS) (ynaI, mscMJ, MSL) [uncultured marine group II/III euryarchaeote AD1000_09_E08]MEE2650948.1 mechanosensitive ion channel family protein [Candidatus Thermoplasmatota archaeon]